MASQVHPQEQEEEGGTGKSIVYFLMFMVVAVIYYLSIDWLLMVPVQNLPFPYK